MQSHVTNGRDERNLPGKPGPWTKSFLVSATATAPLSESKNFSTLSLDFMPYASRTAKSRLTWSALIVLSPGPSKRRYRSRSDNSYFLQRTCRSMRQATADFATFVTAPALGDCGQGNESKTVFEVYRGSAFIVEQRSTNQRQWMSDCSIPNV